MKRYELNICQEKTKCEILDVLLLVDKEEER